MGKSKKFHANDNNLAIAYYRFSSHSQNDASIDQQRELAHTWADTHGYKIIKEYEDAAISGTTEDRPGFRQMLSEVGKIKPHVLILWKPIVWAVTNTFSPWLKRQFGIPAVKFAWSPNRFPLMYRKEF